MRIDFDEVNSLYVDKLISILAKRTDEAFIQAEYMLNVINYKNHNDWEYVYGTGIFESKQGSLKLGFEKILNDLNKTL